MTRKGCCGWRCSSIGIGYVGELFAVQGPRRDRIAAVGFTYFPLTDCAALDAAKNALADIPAGYAVTDSGTTTL
jgi:hypothetical protein